MEQRINYHKEALKLIESLQGRRPRILIHVCCGPCSTHPLKFLHQYFDITVIFHNSNIYPQSEYERRYQTLVAFVERFNQEVGANVQIVKPSYDNDEFNRHLEPYREELEGGTRCFICYRKRMDESMAYAASHGYEYFTTVMTVSPHKDSQIINKIGQALVKKHPSVKYFHSDFKKGDGFLEVGRLSRQYGLYRQSYCGCHG